MSRLSEAVVEQAALTWIEAGGWRIAHGLDTAPDVPSAERHDYGEEVLSHRLFRALEAAW